MWEKSTFINSFAGKACTKTGNKPGVTRGKQWIRLNKNVELLDTPGILWPKFEDQKVGERLACIGSIKDDLLNMEELALILITYLKERYPGALEKTIWSIRRRRGAGSDGRDRESPGLCKKRRRTGLRQNRRDHLWTISAAVKQGVSLWNGRSRKYENSKRNHRRIRNASMRRNGESCTGFIRDDPRSGVQKTTGNVTGKRMKRLKKKSSGWMRCFSMNGNTAIWDISAGSMRPGEALLPVPWWQVL